MYQKNNIQIFVENGRIVCDQKFFANVYKLWFWTLIYISLERLYPLWHIHASYISSSRLEICVAASWNAYSSCMLANFIIVSATPLFKKSQPFVYAMLYGKALLWKWMSSEFHTSKIELQSHITWMVYAFVKNLSYEIIHNYFLL